jgi:CheY-like chemotaxis protein
MAIGRFVLYAADGDVTIKAERGNGQIRLTLAGPPPTDEQPVNWDPIQEILTLQGGSLAIAHDQDHLTLSIEVPSAGDVTVLVVDDNPDMVYFYQRCAEGTRYHIVHESQGQRVFEATDAYAPAVIVLDIMLPDVDGWELLSNLHEHPATRSVPVVVCSVIREKELALALGAAVFLSKPMDHRRFIQALDQALMQAPRGALEAQAPVEATG